MTVQIIRGNALALPLADDTVDLVVTSPPYFGLRSYQDTVECARCRELREGYYSRSMESWQVDRNLREAWPDYDAHVATEHRGHYDGQIGDEATPAEFVDALIAATREMVRVTKPSGSIWVNLGDKYAGNGVMSPNQPPNAGPKDAARLFAQKPVRSGVPTKSLIGIPWRYALRCIDDLGLILRAEVIWSKPNGLPESVTDRVRRSHEQWFHFTLSPRYYSAVDEIREAQAGEFLSNGVRNPRYKYGGVMPNEQRNGSSSAVDGSGLNKRDSWSPSVNPLGKLPGSVWTIPTEPLHVPDHLGIDHFAAYPTEWPRRIVQGWSPRGICVECGEGRRPVAEQTDEAYSAERARVRANRKSESKSATQREKHLNDTLGRTNSAGFGNISNGVVKPSYAITSEACACPEPTAPTRPGLVLDPFGGTGTTALVADALDRHGVHVDMSADYCRLATWRTNDPKQKAKAARREFKPPTPQLDGQLDLLEGLGA
jgi:DNA modification methylase